MARAFGFIAALVFVAIAPCRTTAQSPGEEAKGIVFRVDGASPFRGMGDDLRLALEDAGLPLTVEAFAWSHGPIQILADLHAHAHQEAKGAELAAAILAYRRSFPAGKVYLISHSAGAAIILEAAKKLPPGAVDRIVLLAPAVAPGCDLTPTLRCAREGVDAFFSDNDMVGRILAVIGNADGRFEVAAGSVGFTRPANAENTYGGLRQHAWDWDMARKCGSLGTHFSCTRYGFLCEYVAPLFKEPRTK